MRRFLKDAGVHAEITPDGFTDGGFVLSIGGAEQSHVNLAHPEEVFYEYLRRIANVADVVAPPGASVTAVHLGAGALTLARYVAATRPGSAQTAVELERELPGFVLEALPLPAGADVRIVLGDARAALPGVVAPGTADLVVLDVFSGRDAPRHLTEPAFYAEVAGLLAPTGVLAVNVGDDPGLAFFAGQARALRSVFEDVWCLAEQRLLTGRYPGNLVLVAGRRPLPRHWAEQLAAAGPHPGAVLDGLGLEELLRRLQPARTARAGVPAGLSRPPGA